MSNLFIVGAPVLTTFNAGLTTSGSTSSFMGGGSIMCSQITTPRLGTLQSYTVWIGAGATVQNMVMGLYSNVSGSPNTLLNTSPIVSSTAGAWNNISVPSGPSVAAGTYWIAFNSQTNNMQCLYNSTGNSAYMNTASWGWHSGAFPNPFAKDGTLVLIISMYATFLG